LIFYATTEVNKDEYISERDKIVSDKQEKSCRSKNFLYEFS